MDRTTIEFEINSTKSLWFEWSVTQDEEKRKKKILLDNSIFEVAIGQIYPDLTFPKPISSAKITEFSLHHVKINQFKPSIW